jgi:succinate-semialdehyde dehydrogenase/glutarate-semialdehyde dehydrogenase
MENKSYKDKATLLHTVAKLMRKKKTVLAKLITLEMGKIFSQSESEIDLSANILDYYADNAETFLADKELNRFRKAFVRVVQ